MKAGWVYFGAMVGIVLGAFAGDVIALAYEHQMTVGHVLTIIFR